MGGGGDGVGEVETIIIVYSRPVGVERGVLERDINHRGVQSGCSFECCCAGSNTPWLEAKSDANLILTGASASPWGSRACGSPS